MKCTVLENHINSSCFPFFMVNSCSRGIFPERNLAIDTKVVPLVFSIGRGGVSSFLDPFYLFEKLPKDMVEGKDDVFGLICDTAGIMGYFSGLALTGYLIVNNPLNPLAYLPIMTTTVSAAIQKYRKK